MTPSRWAQIQSAFSTVVQRRRESWSQAAREACGSDYELHGQVGRMLLNFRAQHALLDWAEQRTPSDPIWTPLFPANELLAFRFRVVRFLGRGGMGEVYECRDEVLGVRVAVKTISGDLQGRPGFRSRFLREVEFAQRVTHPNVCRIHDVYRHLLRDPETGEERWVDFLTMQLLRGETLADYLRKRGPMPFQAALVCLRQMAEGLAAAHTEGVVHRDFKPGNIFLLSETGSPRVVVTDFGLAVLCEAGIQDEHGHIRDSSSLYGCTPAYAAPEILDCSRALPESDVYALGVVAFELLTGSVPGDFDLLPSQEVKDAIARCLKTDPADRFQSPLDFVRCLAGDAVPEGREEGGVTRRHLLISISGTAVALAAGALLVKDRSQARGTIAMAVLGFGTQSQDQIDFAEGFTNELVRTLRASTRIRVVSPYGALRLKPPFDFRKIARSLGADTFVTGVFGKSAVEIRLVHPDGSVVWSQTFSRAGLSDFLLHKKVEIALLNQVDKSTAKLVAQSSYEPLPEAYSAYMQGRFLLGRRQATDLAAAESLFRNAIHLAPEFAPGWAGLADTLQLEERLSESGEAARRAIQLAPDDCDAHLALAIVLQRFEWNWNAAEAHFSRALDLEPLNARAHHWYGGFLSDLGDRARSLRELKLAVDLDPLNVPAACALGICLFYSRDFDAAIAQLYRAIHLADRLEHSAVQAYLFLGASFLYKGQGRSALAHYRQALAKAPDDPVVRAHLVYGLARLEHHEEAKREMAALFNSSTPEVRHHPFYIALAWAGLKEKEHAFNSLQSAVQQRDGELTLLKVHPYLDSLRCERAYSDLMNRLQFPV